MDSFLARYGSLVTAVLSGFDRLVFRGSLLPLIRDGGMYFFLEAAGVRLLDFKDFVLATTERVKRASLAEAHRLKRPVCYLDSPAIDKEDLARWLTDVEGELSDGKKEVQTTFRPLLKVEGRREASHILLDGNKVTFEAAIQAGRKASVTYVKVSADDLWVWKVAVTSAPK